MKKLLLLLFVSTNLSLFGQIVNIPDEAFKNCLLGNSLINTNGNNEIEVAEALSFSGQISCLETGIEDFTGIEYFSSITSLSIVKNNYTDLDLSSNTSLVTISLGGTTGENYLTNLNINGLCELEVLGIGGTRINELNLSAHYNLTHINVSNNPDITCLNLANGNMDNLWSDENPSSWGNTNGLFIWNNPNIGCVQIDSGFNIENTGWVGESVHPSISFSDNCNTPCSETLSNTSCSELSNDSINYSIINFSIYPNPTKEYLNIDCSSLESAIIYNILGEELIKETSNRINVSHLPKGVYFIKASDGVNSTTKKFIKN